MFRKYHYYILLTLLWGVMVASTSCKKFIEIEAPRNTVSTEVIFVDSASASSALLGIYSKIMGFYILPKFASGYVTLCAGQSADEFESNSSADQELYNNVLNAESSSIGALWSDAYSNIYQANLVMEGLENSTTIDPAVKLAFTAEAKFVRSFCYFYLTNLFGDLPYVTTSDWTKSFGHGRMPQATIYQNLVADLKLAQQHLPDSFPKTGRVRPIKLAATALLARVYLYQKDWVNAEKEATKVIGASLFAGGLPSLDDAFLKNNTGAIWQLEPNVPNYNTPEGYALVSGGVPTYNLDSSLLADFEPGDQRFTHWVDSVDYKGQVYYYPYKYKVRSESDITEYYTMLRLGEQYLIRAEARCHLAKTAEAVKDLNVIRQRAGLGALSSSLKQQACMDAVFQERRIELFSEWGHRWLDLKRTGHADAVLSKVKPLWTADAVLYPIPLKELKVDPTIHQNKGYE